MTLHAPLERAGSVEFFVQRSAGMLFETPGLKAATTALLHLPHSTNLLVSAYGNVPTGQTESVLSRRSTPKSSHTAPERDDARRCATE